MQATFGRTLDHCALDAAGIATSLVTKIDMLANSVRPLGRLSSKPTPRKLKGCAAPAPLQTFLWHDTKPLQRLTTLVQLHASCTVRILQTGSGWRSGQRIRADERTQMCMFRFAWNAR